MSRHVVSPHPQWLLAVTACICLFQASPASANEGYQRPAQEVPFGGEDCDYAAGPSLVIEPRAHLRAVIGDTDLEDSGLAHGGHDPHESGFSIPALSLGADIFYGEHFAGFAEGIVSWSNEDGWDAELEELYAKFLNLPGGFEIKAGQLLAPVGTQNNIHNHGWKFVDADMGNVRFLGEDGLIIEGAELAWLAPTRWDDRLTLSFGNAVEHAHEEDHADEHGEEEGEDDHDGEHKHNEEAEEALWDSNVFSARYQASFWPGDTCRFVYGASYLQGKNFMGKTARLYGLDITYTWLQDEDHGKLFMWRNEAMLRKVDIDDGSFQEFAFTSAAHYRLNPEWEIGLRYDYLEGVEDPGLPERHRISPALSHYFTMAGAGAIARLQYNYDHSEGRGDDHSIWLQFGFEWGAGSDTHVH
jgi:hypothetical protein